MPLPERDSPLPGLDLVAYQRIGTTVVFIFRHGRYSIAVTSDLALGPTALGDTWFVARSEFRVRPRRVCLSPVVMQRSIDGYGKTEEDAILASVNLFLAAFDAIPRGPDSPP